jgi:CRISPR-associated protein Cmr2
MQHLLNVSIGPVQEFIASARRSRDLWFGSWLLSELSKAAALEIAKNQGLKSLIFPAPDTNEDLAPESKFDVANKILALVDLSQEEVRSFAAKLQAAIQERLGKITDEAYTHIRSDFPDRAKAEAQVKDLIEFSWAALPLEQAQDYSVARTRLEALMAARKATRLFSPTDEWKGPVPKSSLDGQRESVVPETAYPPKRARSDERRRMLRQLRYNYGVRNGERLCGVGLLKRHGQRGRDERFFSTSHVAALPLISRFTEKDRPAIKAYVDVLRETLTASELGNVPGQPHRAFERYDGHLLFEERLQEFYEEDQAALERASKALHQLLAGTVGEKTRPLAYYALLHADGDHMGKAINEQKSADEHRKLSKSLTGFATQVRQLVERRHGGSLVYAGGDDVLAFVPLHEALQCARALAHNFKEKMSGFAVAEEGISYTPTLSVGIAVAHHLEPLSGVLEMARAAEKKAKGIPGKNALAITVSKRSGTDRTVAGRWGEIDTRLEMFIKLHQADAFPDSVAYELRDLSLTLKVSEENASYETLQEAMRFEAVRILHRKRPARGTMAISDTDLKNLEGYILPKSEGAVTTPHVNESSGENTVSIKASPPPLSINQIAGELIVSRLFADAMSLAAGDGSKQEKESN